MSKVSLYRKYRPQNFKNLVGQDHIRTTLLNAIKSGNPSHAYLFCGPRGTGKTSTARLLAKALNCVDPAEDGEPCDKCDICVPIREGNLIDMIEIDAASNRGIDEIRDLKDKINFAPTRAKTKIYIIDEVHMLTKEAFNALLKTLEEPPNHVFFVLATTEVHKIPETIISRCQRFDFKRITKKAIAARLMYIAQLENIKAEQEAIDTIAHISEGGMRDAIGLIEQLTVEGVLTFDRIKEVLGISGQSALETLYKYIGTRDPKSALNEIQNLYSEGTDLVQFTKDFLEFLRNKMLEALNANKLQEIPYILVLIDNFQEAYNKLKIATIPQLPLEIAILKVAADLPKNIQVPQAAPTSNSTPTAPTPSVAPAQPKTPEKTIEVEKILSEVKIETVKPEPEQISNKPPVQAATPATQQPEVAPEAPSTNISEQDRETPEDKIALTISYVKENWARVVELIKTPFVRLSFKGGKPTSLENGVLKVGFTSNFHKEKVEATEAKIEIENAFNKIFAGPVKLDFEIINVALGTSPTVTPQKPSPKVVQPPQQPQPKQAQAESQPKQPQPAQTEQNSFGNSSIEAPPTFEEKRQSDLANQALDLFGGELIED
jgi:DNA polymerase III subunit gamma/tau